MSIQILPQSGSISGRIGKGIGQGLSAALPKVVERRQLSEGLKDFEKNHKGLTPLEQYTRLAAIPGITPSMLQALPEILKQQNLRKAYPNKSNQRSPEEIPGQNQPNGQGIRDINFANINQNQPSKQGNIPSDYPGVQEQAEAFPSGIRNETNPVFQPRPAWTAQRRDDEIGRILDKNPTATLQEAVNIAADNEARERQQPESELAVEERKKITQKDLDDEFDNQLETRLQKTGKETFKDISGTNQLNLKKAAYNDLLTNPKLTSRTAAEKWTQKALDLASAKSEVKTLANRDFLDKISPGKKENVLKGLQSAQKIYAETGNTKEFYDMLRSENSDNAFGFGLSPGAAALIAYPRTEGVKSLLKKNEDWSLKQLGTLEKVSRNFAKEVAGQIKPDDSFLAIAKQMKQVNPYFVEEAYWDWLRDNQDSLGLNPRLKQELVVGKGDTLPNWGDIALFPTTRSVAND